MSGYYKGDKILYVGLAVTIKNVETVGSIVRKIKDELRILKAKERVEFFNIYWQLLVYFVISFGGLFCIYEILDYFKINFFTSFVSTSGTFLLISIIVAMSRYVIFLLKNMPKVDAQSQNVNESNDSLIEMLMDAEAHSRWTEIIKIGSALSDVLWFTSRKKLRLVIGGFVEVAAIQMKDDKTLATTLIEDLGNTVMGLGYPDKGISYIKRGIEIAEKRNYSFLIMRGYRNLANCYSMKNDAKQSEMYLKNAINAVKGITDSAQKLEALGGIEYARCKTLEHANKYDDALIALDECIEYYSNLGKQFPETEGRNRDRLVKVYREKGVIYLKEGRPDLAKSALLVGLRSAEETLNYDNIVRCCILLVKIQLDDGEFQPAEGMLNIAKQHIDKIDIPSIRKEFNDISRRFEIEKESQKKIES